LDQVPDIIVRRSDEASTPRQRKNYFSVENVALRSDVRGFGAAFAKKRPDQMPEVWAPKALLGSISTGAR